MFGAGDGEVGEALADALEAGVGEVEVGGLGRKMKFWLGKLLT